MKKYLIVFAIIYLLLLNLSANDDNPPSGIGLITGIVIDATTNEPMPTQSII